MPNSDLGEGLHFAGSIVDLTKDILTRADRDGPQNELNENLIKIQNAFADNSMDSDAFRIFIDKLCNAANRPLTPTGDPVFGRRELDHTLFVSLAELIYCRQIISRLVSKTVKE